MRQYSISQTSGFQNSKPYSVVCIILETAASFTRIPIASHERIERLDREMWKLLATSAGKFAGIFTQDWLHQRQEKREQDLAARQSLNLVLQHASKVTYKDYDPTVEELILIFNLPYFEKNVRPALYAHFDQLNSKLQQRIIQLDQILNCWEPSDVLEEDHIHPLEAYYEDAAYALDAVVACIQEELALSPTKNVITC